MSNRNGTDGVNSMIGKNRPIADPECQLFNNGHRVELYVAKTKS